jgi:hypothetical protein
MKERPTYCEDWACPARVSCALHFGRSADYARMDERRRFTLKKFDRDPSKDCCTEYEFDKPKKFLAIKPGQITHWPQGAW